MTWASAFGDADPYSLGLWVGIVHSYGECAIGAIWYDITCESLSLVDDQTDQSSHERLMEKDACVYGRHLTPRPLVSLRSNTFRGLVVGRSVDLPPMTLRLDMGPRLSTPDGVDVAKAHHGQGVVGWMATGIKYASIPRPSRGERRTRDYVWS